MPDFRTEKTLPFINIGIDFAGPFSTKANITSRSQAQIKTYICLFVCATSRAIHLELSLDLTTESFIETFCRFTSIRGVPNLIYTDNGKTFESASKSLAKFINGSLNSSFSFKDFLSSDIHWNFIPARSPWWGGFYERMVQIVKRCLKKTMYDQCLNYIQFETLLKKIESRINDRPLMEIQEDPSQQIITPSFLLLGRKIHETPEQSEETSLETIVPRRIKTMESIYNTFWNTFYKEYLVNIKDFKHNYDSGNTNPKIGDIVHIKVENQPRTQWRLGRISEIIVGKDKIVRAAKVKTPLGEHCTEIIRPIQHLYPLENVNNPS